MLLQNKKGQVLVEALIAITLMVVGLLGIFSLVSRSFSLNRVVADQYVGTYLAAEGIELVKNLVDQNWTTIADKGGGLFEIDYESRDLDDTFPDTKLFIDPDGYYNYISGEKTKFTRLITIETPSSDEIIVFSRVEWTTRGGGKFNVNLESHFFNFF